MTSRKRQSSEVRGSGGGMLAKVKLDSEALWFRRTETGVPDKNSIAINSQARKF